MLNTSFWSQCWLCSSWMKSNDILCDNCRKHLSITTPNSTYNIRCLHQLDAHQHHAWINYMRHDVKIRRMIQHLAKVICRKYSHISDLASHSCIKLSNEALFVHCCKKELNHPKNLVVQFMVYDYLVTDSLLCYAIISKR